MISDKELSIWYISQLFWFKPITLSFIVMEDQSSKKLSFILKIQLWLLLYFS